MLLLHQTMFIMVKAYHQYLNEDRVHQEYIEIAKKSMNIKNGVKKFCQGESAVWEDTTANSAYRRRTDSYRNTDYQISIDHHEEPWPFWRGGSIEVVNCFLATCKVNISIQCWIWNWNFFSIDLKACQSRQLCEYNVWKWTVYFSQLYCNVNQQIYIYRFHQSMKLGLVVVINYKWML